VGGLLLLTTVVVLDPPVSWLNTSSPLMPVGAIGLRSSHQLAHQVPVKHRPCRFICKLPSGDHLRQYTPFRRAWQSQLTLTNRGSRHSPASCSSGSWR
jgi:hypothetical protein